MIIEVKKALGESKTDNESDLEKKSSIDQVSQYSTMMTKKLTIGKYKKNDHTKPP